MKCCVQGCAGVIGSTLSDRLLRAGDSVRGLDNFSTGQRHFLRMAYAHPSFQLVEADLFNTHAWTHALADCEVVFHLAANADVRFGTQHPHKDLQQNTMVTFRVLEAMREHQVKKIIFASTGSVYGEAAVFPTPAVLSQLPPYNT